MGGEDYAGLSPEEIEAIKGDDEGGDDAITDDTAGKGRESGDGEAVEQGDSDLEGDKGEKEEAPDSDAKGDSPKNDGKEGVETAVKKDKDVADDPETEASQEQRPFAPKFAGGDQARIDQLKTELDDAKKKFDEGEIDYAVFNLSKDAYNEAKWKADFAQEVNSNMQDERWAWEQERFLDDNRSFRDNALLNSAFVNAVNTIIASEVSATLTDREVLVKAKEEVSADIRALTGQTESPADKKESAKSKAVSDAKKKQADRSKIPIDISDIPSAEENNEVSEFANIDKLSGEAYQTALDNMTPTQLARYEDS